MSGVTFKLVETCTGTGRLVRDGVEVLGPVQYHVERYQGMMNGTGMPVPGLFRLDGALSSSGVSVPQEIVGTRVTLRLEDGRSVPVVIVSPEGTLLAEGHGPGRGCACC
jgi:hypothetical protein